MALRRNRRKAICTSVTGDQFAELYELSRPGLERFADYHGWQLLVTRTDTAQGRPASWGKVPILQDALGSFDLVAWIDVDAVVVDGSRDLAAEQRRGKHLYLVEHAHPSGETTANAGVMMLRASRWTRRLLAEVWASVDLIDHIWWENAALMRLLGYRLDAQPVTRGDDLRRLARVEFLDVAWNSIPHWVASPAPRIKHYAGLPVEERRTLMLADRAEA